MNGELRHEETLVFYFWFREHYVYKYFFQETQGVCVATLSEKAAGKEECKFPSFFSAQRWSPFALNSWVIKWVTWLNSNLADNFFFKKLWFFNSKWPWKKDIFELKWRIFFHQMLKMDFHIWSIFEVPAIIDFFFNFY